MNLPFVAGDPSSVSFGVYWWGAGVAAADISVSLDKAKATLTFTEVGTSIKLTSSSAGTGNATTRVLSGPLSAFGNKFTLGFQTQDTTRCYTGNTSDTKARARVGIGLMGFWPATHSLCSRCKTRRC